MSEYIKKEDVIQEVIYELDAFDHVPQALIDKIKREFDTLPFTDAVGVVRCKDCKHWLPHTQCGFDEDNDEYHNYCNYHMPDDEWYAGYWEADDFCSYGERKDQDHE